ncbi:MAG: hypothetical protein LC649_09750 [Bacteroidales bacterium]|nr:hypothetical protein [Bacteroidales bacterium]
MSHEREGKEKSGKKAPVMNLKEKRAAKAAKREDKKGGGKIIFPTTDSKSKGK